MFSSSYKTMIVLSLFDGIAGAFLALQEQGIPITKYYASEVDPKAILVTKKNHGNSITHLGDVKQVTKQLIPEKIDLLIGGSPCQDLSCAGKREGLQGNRSGLFYEYLRIYRECKPQWFILENVGSMKQQDRDTITQELGVEPIVINSNLVTAQNRKRYYWTNIPNITQPEDRKITIDQVVNVEGEVFIVASRRRTHNGQHYQNLEARDDGKSNTLTSVLKDNYVSINGELYPLTPEEYEQLQGIPQGYTSGVPKGTRYKLVANAFTIPVMAHILSHLPEM